MTDGKDGQGVRFEGTDAHATAAGVMLTELVRWTALIRRGEPLPTSDGRGAPEFEVLRSEMRQMEVGLAAGRQAAIEAERLEAFRESARQVAHELKNPLTSLRSAIEVAKLLVGMGATASGITFPVDHPTKWRRRKAP